MEEIHDCYGTGMLHDTDSVPGDPSFDGAKKTPGKSGHPKSQNGQNGERNQQDAR